VACDVIVLAGTEQPTEQTVPYHAITQALRRGIYLAGITLAIEPIWLAEASLLLPELRTLYPDLALPLQTDPAQARTRLFEALCRLLLAIAAGERPVLLCLDDLHWADSATLDWLSFLGQKVRDQRLLVIGTYRSEEPDRLAVVRQGCGRLGILTEIELDGLAIPEIGQILQQVDRSGRDHAHLIRRLHQTTGGNAFFLFEILQAFAESGKSVDTLVDAPDIPLSQTVGDTVMRRFHRLRPMAQQVLEASAVLGLEFSYALLNHTVGRGEMETIDGLDELVKRRLLKEQTDSYCFHHEITRRVIYQSLSHGRRRLLHRRAGETLEAIHSADLDVVSGQIAGHYEAGGMPAQALRFYQHAAGVAVRLFANAEAVAHLQRAIDLLPMAQQDHRMTAQIYEALADTFVMMGQHAKARLNYTKTQEFIPKGDLVWQTQLKIKIGDTCCAVQNYLEALVIYQEADDLLQTASLSAKSIAESTRWQTWFRLQFARVEVYYFLNDLEAMSTLLTELQEPVQQQALLSNEITYYYSLSLLRLRQERFCVSAETVALVYRLMTLTEQTDDQLSRAAKRFSYGFCLLWHGDTSAAIGQFQLALNGGEATGDIPLQDRCLAYLAVAYRRLGNQAQVKFYTERNLIIAQTEQRSAYLGVARASQAWLYFCAGDWAAAITEGQSALQLWTHGNVYPFQWLVHWPLLAISLANGRLADSIYDARAMLGPDQQQLPVPLADLLQAAIAAWDQQQPTAATAHLQQALQLARASGYL
jgi:tetratricopeptide (TPR) repeat protein